MGYQPNSIASSLRNKKTQTIGVITHRIDRHFQSNAISGIQDKAHEYGYNIIICQTNDDQEREIKQFQALFSSRMDGMIGDRKSVVKGKSVSVRVDLGGRSSIQTKKDIERAKRRIRGK